MQSQTKNFTVAIVGGGMCGTTLAFALARSGIKCDLFESAAKFGEIGAGVGLGPNALRALDSLGVKDVVIKKSGQTPEIQGFYFVSGIDEPIDGKYKVIHEQPTTKNDGALIIHRSIFMDAVGPLLPSHLAQFNKKCVDVMFMPDIDRYRLFFSDGTIHDADVVVGADGIHSVIRKRAVTNDIRCRDSKDAVNTGEKHTPPPDSHLTFTGWAAYRSLIPRKELEDAGVTMDLGKLHCVVGPHKHLVIFPLRNKTVVNIVAFTTDVKDGEKVMRTPPLSPPWVHYPVPTSKIVEDYEGWNRDTITILEHMKDSSAWFIHSLDPPLESYVSSAIDNVSGKGGRVVLVGDAAHASSPHLAAGVGQGFEDVFMLWRLLAHPQTEQSNLPAVLKAYDTVRRPRANGVTMKSFETGLRYESYGLDSETTEVRNAELDRQLKESLNWPALWQHDLEADLTVAIDSLRSNGTFF